MRKKIFHLLLMFVCLVAPAHVAASSTPYYHWSDSRLFWFMVISDTHIGTFGSQDTNYLQWAVTEAKQIIDPLFIVNTGDLTDSTNGGIIPNGPYQDEWDEYLNILEDAGIDASFYYDIPGNHDAYNDAYFAYYLANSIQGRAKGRCQHSWIRQFDFGNYLFMAVNTAGNDGAPFSIWPWKNFGDNAGLDEEELSFIESELVTHPDADLAFVFGHHPFEAGYSSIFDTGLTYGRQALLNLMDEYHIPMYGFGHTHEYRENFYSQDLTHDVMYLNFASLGKSDNNHYTVMAIDGNGISVKPANAETWPLVMITAPTDQKLGDDPNPLAYAIGTGRANPIRALIFDNAPVINVQFCIDKNEEWHNMRRIGSGPVWQGFWNAQGITAGFHTITVRAIGSDTSFDEITTLINPSLFIGDGDRDSDVDGSDLCTFSQDYVKEIVPDIAASYGR